MTLSRRGRLVCAGVMLLTLNGLVFWWTWESWVWMGRHAKQIAPFLGGLLLYAGFKALSYKQQRRRLVHALSDTPVALSAQELARALNFEPQLLKTLLQHELKLGHIELLGVDQAQEVVRYRWIHHSCPASSSARS